MARRPTVSTNSDTMLDPLLSEPTVIKVTTLSRATIRRKIEDGSFPRPLKIGKSRIAFRGSDVRAWIDAQSRAA